MMPDGATHIDCGPGNAKWLRITCILHDYWCKTQKRWVTFEGGHNKLRSHWKPIYKKGGTMPKGNVKNYQAAVDAFAARDRDLAGWVVALDFIDDQHERPSCYMADFSGDPGRTCILENAKIYRTIRGATFGLAHARKYRDFIEAKPIKIKTIVETLAARDRDKKRGK